MSFKSEKKNINLILSQNPANSKVCNIYIVNLWRVQFGTFFSLTTPTPKKTVSKKEKNGKKCGSNQRWDNGQRHLTPPRQLTID